MQAELAPGQHLEQLVERARAAGQNRDGVRVHEHHLLALVHRLGDDMPSEVAHDPFAPHEMFGDHAERAPARILRRPRHRAHQPDIARAVDQFPAVAGEHASGLFRSFPIGRVLPVACAAKDTDRRVRHDLLPFLEGLF